METIDAEAYIPRGEVSHPAGALLFWQWMVPFSVAVIRKGRW